jgi:5-methylcytosine-specific restriction endonuclease McrA
LEDVKEKNRIYNAAHRAESTTRSALWCKNHPERSKEIKRNWRINNPEKGKAWAAANAEKVRLIKKKSRITKPESGRSATRNRRARLRGNGGTHTANDIERLMRLQRGKCVYCLVSIRRTFHVDHIIPIKLGGSNAPENLQLLCAPCNQTKNAKHPIDFAQERGLLL